MIAILDYGLGNVGAIHNMLTRIGVPSMVTGRPLDLENASHLIMPGIGSFDAGMRRLRASGLVPLLSKRVMEDGVPVLGICLGMQLMTLGSDEGSEQGLGWLDSRCIRFLTDSAAGGALHVPHMRWNRVQVVRPSPLFRPELPEEQWFYFTHSYHVVCHDSAAVAGLTPYGGDFISAVHHGNVMGVQFHPEKSHRFGMALLSRFATLAQDD